MSGGTFTKILFGKLDSRLRGHDVTEGDTA
jgi:hypothetical protein